MIKLGNLELASPLLTSPLCGISNRPFRLLAKHYGSGLSYVEMLKTTSVVRRHPKAMELLRYFPDEAPLGAQFASNDPEELSEACKIAEGMGFETIDLNSGCPAGRVGKELCGARLMSRPDIAAALMSAMRKAVSVPVTIKIRAGMDDSRLNFLEFGHIAQEEGMNWITIHPRTRAQGYKGPAIHDRTAELKSRISIPVIASGDVTEPEHAMALFRNVGVDGVMIGRGLFGRPWLFQRINAAIHGKNAPETPAPREVLAVMRWHFEGLLDVFSPRLSCLLQRRYSGWYIRGIPGAASLRARFMKIESPEEFRRVWEATDAELASLEAQGRIEVTPKERLEWSFHRIDGAVPRIDSEYLAEEKASIGGMGVEDSEILAAAAS